MLHNVPAPLAHAYSRVCLGACALEDRGHLECRSLVTVHLVFRDKVSREPGIHPLN